MAKPYQNREIDGKFGDIKEALDRIEAQTTKTNGRVTSLEEAILNQRLWRAYMTGAIAVVGFFVAMILIPIVAAYIQTLHS